MRALAAALLTFTWLAFLGPSAPAHADQVCHTETETVIDPVTGNIKTIVKEVCTDDGEDGGGGAGGSTGCSYEGNEIPCTDGGGGIWFNSQACYASDVTATYEEQRGDADGVWQGHTDGSIWMCNGEGPNHLDVGTPFIFWSDQGTAPVDGAVLAQQALDNMPLAKPTIHMAPQPPLMTYVGLKTWLWIDNDQWANVTGGASVPTATVAVTATPVRVRWNLTDGKKKCTSAGRAWIKGMSSSEATDCGYVFQKVSDFQPKGEFPVTSTIWYRVDWTCTGNCITGAGSLGEHAGPTAEGAIRVGERQSVVISSE